MPKLKTVEYTEEDRAYFVEPQFIQARSRIAPKVCNEGGLCWARFGPPCLHPKGHCLGCEGRPSILNDNRFRARVTRYA